MINIKNSRNNRLFINTNLGAPQIEEERTRGEETSSTIVVGGYCCNGAVSEH